MFDGCHSLVHDSGQNYYIHEAISSKTDQKWNLLRWV